MPAIAADRDLLFGLLALQNGLIDQVQLVAAFQAWTRDKARPLAEHLAARGDLAADQRAGVEAMVGLHLKKHGGNAGKSLAALPAGPSTRESLAALGDPALEQTLTHVGSASEGDPDRTASYAVGTATSDGQRFRVLRPHARGGLGAVFVALDAELHREVALKQILDNHADDPTSRARFLLEAEITGGLEHPGIVPVYGLGTYANGRPFYAMRFIRGDSLKAAADRFHADESLKTDPGRRSLELRKLLRRFTDVCNAVDYAHSRGVLHRDIKPGNIIVGRHGETLVVDWGLAKALGRTAPGSEAGERTLLPPSASGSSETLPGSALGTPAYMSPEQACGDLEHLGPRSDVYSLGATLFCLLTGKPPQDADDIGEMLRKVQRGEFPRPRQLDPAIDRALEAVSLKAMALNPECRYPTARALAEDIDRWMADEPVSAWREPWRWRARRWLVRHRSLVASGAAALLIVAVVSATAAVLVEAARRNEARAFEARTKALNAEMRARAEADRRLKDASEVVDTFLDAVSDDLDKIQGAQKVRRRLLQQAADYFARVVQDRSSDPEIEYQALRTTYRSGKIRRILGDLDAAISLYSDAARRGDELLLEAPGSSRLLDLLGSAHLERGLCLLTLGRTNEAEAAYRQASRASAAAVASEPDDAEILNHLASAHNNLGVLLHGQPTKAEPEYRRAIGVRRELVRGRPDNPGYFDDLGSSLTNLGLIEDDLGRKAEALKLQRESVEVRERGVALSPENAQYLRGLALSQTHLANVLGNLGRDDEAAQVYNLANAKLLTLVERNPEVPEFRWRKAIGLTDVTEVLIRVGRSEEALRAVRAAVPEFEALVRRTPGSPQYRFGLASGVFNLSKVLDNLKRYIEAEPHARRACELVESLAARDPAEPKYGQLQGVAHLSLGQILHHLGRDVEAEGVLRRAIESLDRAARSHPDLPAIRDDLGRAWGKLAACHKDRGNAKACLQALDEAMAYARAARERNSGLPQPRADLAELHRERGEVLLMLDRPDEAADEADRLAALRTGEVGDLVGAARLLSRAAGAVRGNRVETYAGRALERLRSARRIGPVDVIALAHDPGFAAIASRTDFRTLMMDLAMPADAFAH
jgi:eukaryotic-like serine/threonine-protein kinase